MTTPDDKTLDDLVGGLPDDDYEAAADAIAALRERIAALEAENSRLANDYNVARDAHDRRQSERDALQKDAEKYRLLRDRAPSFNRAVFELTGRWPEGVSDADQRLDAARDALRQALVEQQRIDAQICRTAQDWSDGSLGWNRACERMALAIEKQTARDALKEGKL